MACQWIRTPRNIAASMAVDEHVAARAAATSIDIACEEPSTRIVADHVAAGHPWAHEQRLLPLHTRHAHRDGRIVVDRAWLQRGAASITG